MLHRLLTVLVVFGLWTARLGAAETPPGLDIYFIDTEGGAATLIVTPTGESILVDTGNPETRDADRIYQTATTAGLKGINHLITTHWHADHYGGVGHLAKLIPIARFYDHGIPDTLQEDPKRFPALIQAYREASGGKSITLKPGDEVALKQPSAGPALRLRCLCGDGSVIADAPNSPANAVEQEQPKPEDKSDNARSVGFLLTYGDFRFLDLGDLTWNVEEKLVRPTDKIGPVDVYQVTHHGLDSSNNPVLMKTVKPRVAICNNGARKGAAPVVIAMLRRLPETQAVYQLHRNVTPGAENTDPEYIANSEEKCSGDGIKLSVAPDGKNYSVTVGKSGKSHQYATRVLNSP